MSESQQVMALTMQAHSQALTALEQLSALLHTLAGTELINAENDLFHLMQLAQSLAKTAIVALEDKSS